MAHSHKKKEFLSKNPTITPVSFSHKDMIAIFGICYNLIIGASVMLIIDNGHQYHFFGRSYSTFNTVSELFQFEIIKCVQNIVSVNTVK